MSEFDFDELDKAVNSLMQQRDTSQPPSDTTPASDASPDTSTDTPSQQSQPAQATADTSSATSAPVTVPARSTPTSTVADTPTAQPDQSASTPDEAAAATSAPAAGAGSLATKRRGQFMDVMHPSADMNTKDTTTPASSPSAPQTRTGTTLQPLSSSVKPDNATTTPSAESETDAASDSDVSKGDWPDPLDMMEQKESAKKQLDESKSSEDAAALTPESPVSETEPSTNSALMASELEHDPDSMESPFLPDAKVEKRPLGGETASAEPTPDVPDQPSSTPDQPVGTDATPADSTTIEQLPAELSSHVMDVESDSTPQPETTPAPVPSTPETAPAEPTASPSTKPAEPAPAADAPPQLAPATPASNQLVGALPPRQPATTDQAAADDDVKHSIYDTDHQPMKHEQKHSSGWFAVVIIGSMLVIGAIGGVILFLLNNGY